MIILDGRAFHTEGLSEVEALRKFSSHDDALTGQLIVTESQYVRNRRTYTLLVDREARTNLKNLLAEVGAHDLVDHTGFAWLTSSGTDNSQNSYSTGAYFAPNTELVFRPQQANGDACDNRWQVDVTFIINARFVNGNSGGSIVGDEFIEETPGGTINGVNVTFTLSQIPDTLFLFVNGVYQTVGVDYTVSGSTITYLAGAIPQTGDAHRAVYTT